MAQQDEDSKGDRGLSEAAAHGAMAALFGCVTLVAVFMACWDVSAGIWMRCVWVALAGGAGWALIDVVTE